MCLPDIWHFTIIGTGQWISWNQSVNAAVTNLGYGHVHHASLNSDLTIASIMHRLEFNIAVWKLCDLDFITKQ